jgi:hypothetical protein
VETKEAQAEELPVLNDCVGDRVAVTVETEAEGLRVAVTVMMETIGEALRVAVTVFWKVLTVGQALLVKTGNNAVVVLIDVLVSLWVSVRVTVAVEMLVETLVTVSAGAVEMLVETTVVTILGSG